MIIIFFIISLSFSTNLQSSSQWSDIARQSNETSSLIKPKPFVPKTELGKKLVNNQAAQKSVRENRNFYGYNHFILQRRLRAIKDLSPENVDVKRDRAMYNQKFRTWADPVADVCSKLDEEDIIIKFLQHGSLADTWDFFHKLKTNT